MNTFLKYSTWSEVRQILGLQFSFNMDCGKVLRSLCGMVNNHWQINFLILDLMFGSAIIVAVFIVEITNHFQQINRMPTMTLASLKWANMMFLLMSMEFSVKLENRNLLILDSLKELLKCLLHFLIILGTYRTNLIFI